MVGTHVSEAQHDMLVALLRAHDWREVMNLPRNRTNATEWGDIDTGDGFLLYDNPELS